MKDDELTNEEDAAVNLSGSGDSWTNHLAQSRPNPFSQQTAINYQLSVGQQVNLSVYNMAGQHIKSLVNGHQISGDHTVKWDGTNDSGERVTSGMYLYRIDAPDFSDTKRMILMR